MIPLLQALSAHARCCIYLNYRRERPAVLDLTANNPCLTPRLLADPERFSHYVEDEIEKHGALYAVGLYGEDRVIYHRFPDGKEPRRTIHLGLDLWASAGMEVFAVLPGEIDSFANNSQPGDYGPTILLRHEADGIEFHTLYGHLSMDSLSGLKEGQWVEAGASLGTIGTVRENGEWPPHLHFQIIRSMGEYFGDYPGVCASIDTPFYFENCPDPNLLLKIRGLSPALQRGIAV